MIIFMLFAFDAYYPTGGMGDCIATTVAGDYEAGRAWAREQRAASKPYEYWEIVAVDPESGRWGALAW